MFEAILSMSQCTCYLLDLAWVTSTHDHLLVVVLLRLVRPMLECPSMLLQHAHGLADYSPHTVIAAILHVLQCSICLTITCAWPCITI
jgi:hypothetical protein